MPKRKNPETSLEAYRKLDPLRLAKSYNDILLALAEIKEGTMEDIANHLRCKPSKVWKRLSELQANNLIYRPGNKRPLESGSLGYTWMLVTKGVAPTKVTERIMPGPSISEYSRKLIQQNLF